MTFQVGDLVQLKSGSSAMTVTGVFPDGVRLAWGEGKSIERVFFPVEALMPATVTVLAPEVPVPGVFVPIVPVVSPPPESPDWRAQF